MNPRIRPSTAVSRPVTPVELAPVDVTKDERRMFILNGMDAGESIADIVRGATKKFGVERAVIQNDIRELARAAGVVHEDPDFWVHVMASVTDGLRLIFTKSTALATQDIELPEGEYVSPEMLNAINKVRKEATRAALSSAGLLIDLAGRRNPRWGPKSVNLQFNLDVEGMDVAEQKALSVLFGQAPVPPTSAGDIPDAEYEEV